MDGEWIPYYRNFLYYLNRQELGRIHRHLAKKFDVDGDGQASVGEAAPLLEKLVEANRFKLSDDEGYRREFEFDKITAGFFDSNGDRVPSDVEKSTTRNALQIAKKWQEGTLDPSVPLSIKINWMKPTKLEKLPEPPPQPIQPKPPTPSPGTKKMKPEDKKKKNRKESKS